jgi:hypothetical protein
VPQLKGWDCADIEGIAEWQPTTDEVVYWLTLQIGPPDDVGTDNFDVCVATPPGLRSDRGRSIAPAPTRGDPIVLVEYSWPAVLAELQRRLDSCAGPTWLHVQDELRRFFRWEYEGMR